MMKKSDKTPTAPVEPKVQASGVAAGMSGAALWLLQHYIFKGMAVPEGVASMIYIATPSVLAVAAGWNAQHQYRTPASSPLPAAPVAYIVEGRIYGPEDVKIIRSIEQAGAATVLPPEK